MARLIRLIRLPAARRRLLVEAAGELARAAGLVRLRPFRHYRAGLGEAVGPEVRPAWTGRMDELRDIRWALTRLNALAGDRFTCLMLAIAGKRMLTRRAIPNALVLGARRERAGEAGTTGMAAHAWLRVGEGVLLGADAVAGNTPIVSFLSTMAVNWSNRDL